VATPAGASGDGFTQVVAVQRGNLSASVDAVGELQAVQQEDLRFDRVTNMTALPTMKVEPGYLVQEGQVLAGIDPSPYPQAVDQASSELQEAEESCPICRRQPPNWRSPRLT